MVTVHPHLIGWCSCCILLIMAFIFQDYRGMEHKYNPYSSSWTGLAKDEDHRFTEWEVAQKFCKSIGGHLLTLETLDSMEWFRSQILLALNDPENSKWGLRLLPV